MNSHQRKFCHRVNAALKRKRYNNIIDLKLLLWKLLRICYAYTKIIIIIMMMMMIMTPLNQVQFDALEAAVSNLCDHYNSSKTQFEAAQLKLQAQQDKHKFLLDNFEINLDKIRAIPLHPVLTSAMAQSAHFAMSIAVGTEAPSSSSCGSGLRYCHTDRRAHMCQQSICSFEVYMNLFFPVAMLGYNQVEAYISFFFCLRSFTYPVTHFPSHSIHRNPLIPPRSLTPRYRYSD